MNCNVCIENYNNTSRKEVKCHFCEYNACRECYMHYILESKSEMINCMNCQKEWTQTFLYKNFTQKFLDGDFKNHKENILFEKERALFPATQLVIERMNQKNENKEMLEKILNKMIKCNEEKNTIQKQKKQKKQLFNYYKSETDNKNSEIIKKLKKEIKELKETLDYLNDKLKDLSNHYHYYKIKNDNTIFNVKMELSIKKCNSNNCRGFLDENYKCGICHVQICSECYETTSDDEIHVCKKENLDTIKLLAEDSKACPRCGVLIYKTDGCAQIWCVKCHTAFDWNTGKIETHVHNPHYYEWLRTNGDITRNPADIQCGREIDRHFITRLMSFETYDITIMNYCGRMMYLRYDTLPRYNVPAPDNEDLRIEYLQNKIDEDKFKNKLYKRFKSHLKRTEIAQIIGTFIASVTDILYRYATDPDIWVNKVLHKTEWYMLEINQLRYYINECLEEVSKIYKSKIYILDDELFLI